MMCIAEGCERKAHAQGRCPQHYNAYRRAHPEVEVRKRSSPTATIPERVALHVEEPDDEGHRIWNGYTRSGVPSLRILEGDTRVTYNVRALQLTEAGHPKPTNGRWHPVPTCGVEMCVTPEHLSWTNRRRDTALDNATVDDLITRHARGQVNLTDEADRLGVDRRTVYQAMAARGYKPAMARRR